MEKVRRLEKGTPPPVVAVVTIKRYGDNDNVQCTFYTSLDVCNDGHAFVIRLELVLDQISFLSTVLTQMKNTHFGFLSDLNRSKMRRNNLTIFLVWSGSLRGHCTRGDGPTLPPCTRLQRPRHGPDVLRGKVGDPSRRDGLLEGCHRDGH